MNAFGNCCCNLVQYTLGNEKQSMENNKVSLYDNFTEHALGTPCKRISDLSKNESNAFTYIISLKT